MQCQAAAARCQRCQGHMHLLVRWVAPEGRGLIFCWLHSQRGKGSPFACWGHVMAAYSSASQRILVTAHDVAQATRL